MLMFAFAFTAYAETVVDVSGQVRIRGEANTSGKSFDDNAEHVQTFRFLRTRLNIKALIDDNATVFIQFQDSRVLGDGTQSGSLDNDSNVGLHQAFIKYNLRTKEKWSIGVQAGRFEYNWGNQRLLGAVGWHNVGRSWEGSKAWYNAEKFNVSIATLKKREDNSIGYDSDFNVGAIALKLKEVNLDFIAIVEMDSDTLGLGQKLKMLERVTLAAYYKRKIEQIDMEFNLAIQGGTQAVLPDDFDPDNDVITNEQDISALMFTGEVGYSLEGDKNARVALGVDYASGDDGADSTKDKRFNNLYWTGHKFNGYMDYFLGGGPNGLMDIALRGKFDVAEGWTVGADLHLFSAAEDYSYIVFDGDGAPLSFTTKDIGSELDIFVKTSRVNGVALQWGFSTFTAKDEFAVYKHMDDPGFDYDTFKKQSTIWAYCQAIVNF